MATQVRSITIVEEIPEDASMHVLKAIQQMNNLESITLRMTIKQVNVSKPFFNGLVDTLRFLSFDKPLICSTKQRLKSINISSDAWNWKLMKRLLKRFAKTKNHIGTLRVVVSHRKNFSFSREMDAYFEEILRANIVENIDFGGMCPSKTNEVI